MTCAAPERELLPFLAAGSLSDDERQAAITHASGCTECGEELRTGRQLADGLRSLHLTADEVVDAAWSSTRPAHLTECPRCAADVDAITRVNAELGGAALAGGRPRLAAAWVPYLGMAAALVLSVGLGFRVNALTRENRRLDAAMAGADQVRQERDAARTGRAALEASLERLSQPQVNAPIANLEPAGGLRGPGGGGVPDVPANATFVTLVLHLVEDTPARNCDVEVTDAQGRLVWKGEGLVKSELGTLSLGMPMRLLPRGEYRVRLLAPDGGNKAPVETYAFRVR
jgi:hypothetical protein